MHVLIFSALAVELFEHLSCFLRVLDLILDYLLEAQGCLRRGCLH